MRLNKVVDPSNVHQLIKAGTEKPEDLFLVKGMPYMVKIECMGEQSPCKIKLGYENDNCGLNVYLSTIHETPELG